MDLPRLYLFSGLLAHKFVWELLKRRGRDGAATPKPRRGFRAAFLKAAKLGILAGILAQTWLPDILPITGDAGTLRLAGAVIYTAGLLAAIAARIQLGRNWSDIEQAEIRQRHTLVAKGIYRYIRHPIYTADLALLFGLELALNSWLVAGVLVLAPFVLRQAIREERALLASLPGYEAYCARTKRFLPFVV